MFIKILFAAVFLLATSPAFVSAQDFFFSFDENSRVTTSTGRGGSTGALFLFADENLDFNQLDLDIVNPRVGSANAHAILLREITTFNDGGKFTSFESTLSNTRGSTLFAESNGTAGQIPANQDADFRAGANGFLLARIDFEVSTSVFVSAGQATTIQLFEGALGVVDDGIGALSPTFGTNTFTVVGVPEPSSAVMLAMASVGVIARRRRS